MKAKFRLIAALLAVLLIAAGCSAGAGNAAPRSSGAVSEGKLSVYTSFYPMYDFAAKIGGDRAQVTNMVRPGMEVHHWEPEAADIAGLEGADVFIYNGAGMEPWVDKVLSSLDNKSLVVVEASGGIALNQKSGHSHDGEDEKHSHGSMDPHTWLSPLNAKKQMENIKDAFSSADPANAEYYKENYNHYAQELDKLDKEFKDRLGTLVNKEVIVAHEAFGYLCAQYGLEQIGVDGLAPDSEPDPARIAEVIEFAKEHKVGTIFFEQLASPKVAQVIADATGAKTAVLTPIEALSDEQIAAGDDYFSVMRQNLDALYEALKP